MTILKYKFIYYHGLERVFNHPILCSALFFGIYWIGPAFLLIIDNVVSTSNDVFIDVVKLYAGDLTHLLFALVVSFGSFFAARMCGIINSNEDKIVCRDEFKNETTRTTLIFQKISNGFLINIIALVICSFSASVVIDIILTEENWWGVTDGFVNSSGVLFVINTSAMIFIGISVFLQISLRSILSSVLAVKFIHIDFFHADGCNGQKKVGSLIMHGWALSITCVSSIFILYYMGYLGIEKSVVSAVISFVLIFAIPMISILPLAAIVRSVNEEKTSAINKINNKSRIIEKLNGNNKIKSHLDVGEYFAIRSYVESANIWPFNLKAISIAVIAYILQSVLVFDQLINVIKKWWLS